VSLAATPRGGHGVNTPWHAAGAFTPWRRGVAAAILPGMDYPPEPAPPCRSTRHAEVACAAYAIFTRHGSRDGDDVRNWLDAEWRIQAQHATTVHGRPTSALGSGHASS